MTMPSERTRTILQTRDFLRELLDPAKTPRVPKSVRREAHRLLRHYPGPSEIEMSRSGFFEVFGPALGDESAL